MAVRLYNTLTRRAEEFKPLTPWQVTMYVCGPTVYDDPHLGHARSAFVFDVLRRYFEYRKYQVTFIRNVTDVDDKIIQKARELGEPYEAVTERYLASYHRTLEALGIAPPTKEPRATAHIDDMIELIAQLIVREKAYVAGGDVYFSVRAFQGYGKLSNRSLDDLKVGLPAPTAVGAQAGARVEPGEQKRDPLDFALWKAAKPGEPAWDSPWGKGRPGWHIECSAMSTKYLGDAFDIHGGGVDLVFPHHENEIAQANAAGKPFARYWIHNGLLTINSQKMSKSLGNFVTVEQVLERYDAEVLKFFFLSTHYRSPIDFTWEKLESIQHSLTRFDALWSRLAPLWERHDISGVSSDDEEADQYRNRFHGAMNADLNTPEALSVFYDLASACHARLNEAKQLSDEVSLHIGTLHAMLLEIMRTLGLSMQLRDQLDETEERLIKEREEARKHGDYATADRKRKELLDQGVILEDTSQGTVWRRKR